MIPEDWTDVELGEVATFKGGSGFKERFQGKPSGDLPFIKVSDMNLPGNEECIHFSQNWVSKDEAREMRASPMPARSIVFAKVGAALLLNKRRRLVMPTIIDNNMMAAIPNEKRITSDYLFRFLTTIDLGKFAQASAVPSVNQQHLSELPTFLPPVGEQEAINSLLETWDRAIETVEALIANARAQKQALMQQLLPQGTTPPKKRLPGFSGEWREAEFNEVFDLKIGGTPARKNPAYWDGGKATQNRWVAISDLRGKYIDETQEHISNEGVQNSNVKALVAGTVIFSFKLSIGRRAILRKSAYTNEAICALIPKRPDELSSLFVFHVLELVDFTASTDQAVKGATLNKAKIADLCLSFPPRAEQDRLVEVLENADSEIKNLQSQLTALRQEKAALMQQLLTGKRRVKLPERPAPESEVAA